MMTQHEAFTVCCLKGRAIEDLWSGEDSNEAGINMMSHRLALMRLACVKLRIFTVAPNIQPLRF